MNAEAPNTELIAELRAESRHADPGRPAGNETAAVPRLSRTHRVSSTLAGLAAGFVLIAYGEGVFDTPPAEPARIVSPAPPAKILTPPAPRASAPAAPAAKPRRPASSGVAVAKKRPAASTAPSSKAVRPIPNVKPRERRNFLGLRTVADWITGRSKADRPGEAGETRP